MKKEDYENNIKPVTIEIGKTGSRIKEKIKITDLRDQDEQETP